MPEIGYSLSSEEASPQDLVRYAQRAEDSGFSFALISDHYHPWIERQGQSPFVWAVIGAIAQATKTLSLGTGVTCPILRIHPAIVAQAAATAAVMMEGRFFMGLGTGENLNEHILGLHWPPIHVRQEMLAEAVEILRLLWRGEMSSHDGRYFTVERARIFSLPDKPPPIMIAAVGSSSARLAGSIGDGLISTAPNQDVVSQFHGAGNRAGKPCYGQMTVCWARTQEQARQIAREWWPVAAIPGKLMTELATPADFEAAAQLLGPESIAEKIIVGPDPEAYIAQIKAYSEAGFDHIYIHQIGPDQQGFFRFFEGKIQPKLRAK